MSWNEEKVEKLKELWGKGSTASQIAEIIGGIKLRVEDIFLDGSINSQLQGLRYKLLQI